MLVLMATVIVVAACHTAPPCRHATPSKTRHVYLVHLIPLHQELGVPPRVDQLEEQACYVFTMESPEVDLLFRTARATMLLNKTKPRIVRDPRIKLVQHETRKALAITADLDVMATDAVHVYEVKPEIVRKAAAAVVKAAAAAVAVAQPPKGRYSGCFDPEPSKGWWEGRPRNSRSGARP